MFSSYYAAAMTSSPPLNPFPPIPPITAADRSTSGGGEEEKNEMTVTGTGIKAPIIKKACDNDQELPAAFYKVII